MERFSGSHFVDTGQVDPAEEWAAPGGETGLEEPMWQLGLGGGSEQYPERPNEADCIYYLRTGFCGYGPRCRFNHPHDRGTAMVALRASGGEYPERIGQPVCQYYMRTGICKYGASCKYDHPKHRADSSTTFAINFYGYPLRQGEKECSYYVKTGRCKFGVTCKFHHPQPDAVQVLAPIPSPGPLAAPAGMPGSVVYPTVQSPVQPPQQYGVIPGNWSVARPSMLPGPYASGSYGPMIFPPGVVPVPGWAPYQPPVGPVASTQPAVGANSIYGITQLFSSATGYTEPYHSLSSSAGPSNSSQKEHSFPDRPGKPECQYYLITGGCKYGSTCKYHHPPEWSAPKTHFLLSPMGLPLRPGSQICSHFAQNGVCKYGPFCKFDHPMRTLSYSTSASSLTDISVAPYPVGSTNATLAPSSSSSDLMPDFISGFSKDTVSSVSSSSASVGLLLAKSGPAPQSGIQQSGHGSASSRGSSSTSKGEG